MRIIEYSMSADGNGHVGKLLKDTMNDYLKSAVRRMLKYGFKMIIYLMSFALR